MRLSVLMDGSYKATHGVDLAIENRRADVVEAVGQGGAGTPAIRGWIVFIVIHPCHAFDSAADHVHFSRHRS